MRAIAVLLMLVALATVAQAHDAPDESRASVELSTARTTRYIGEPIDVRLRLTYDARWFQDHAIPVFLRPLDVALKVDCPALPTDPVAPTDPTQSFALNDGVASAAWLAGSGGGPASLVVDRTAIARAVGGLAVGPPLLRFSYADRFTDDIVNGRVAVDRKDALVSGSALTIHVLPLPDADRPPEFEGALGRFEMTVEVERRAVDVEQVFHVTVRIDADGLASIPTTPRFDMSPRFHVYGAKDDRGSPRRTVVYDVAAKDGDARDFPSLAFAYFDPTPPAAYRFARTAPIPMTVRGATRPEGRPAQRHEADVLGLVHGLMVLSVGALVLLVGLIWLVRARNARRRARLDPKAALLVAAGDRFRARAWRPHEDVSAAFAEFLAVRLDQPVASVISQDLAMRLATAGVAPALAEQTARAMEALVASRYGGRAINVAEVDALVTALGGSISGRAG